MALSGEEIRTRLSVFAAKWSVYQMDDGAWNDLRDLHRELDEAVAAAYGWPKSVAHDPDESNRRLLELNRAIAAGEVEYEPFRER